MSTMNISLPEALKSFVDSQVTDGDYTSSSEYLRELIRKEKDRVHLRSLILEGAASELSDRAFDETYFDGLKKKIRSHSK
ncbi:MAG: type II toxin-antitoxin system ParD family antitoxin [bacterium]|nr:type II toxin-antitoxin system ParD family antitoxin [bacterium]